MKADNIALIDFLSQSKTLFEIPVYQRNYEWGETQCRQLFSDLIRSIESNNKHFIGAVVYVENSGDKMSHIDIIIDGQQRLTSCMLLLKAIAESDRSVEEEIEENFLTNRYVSLNDHIKLKPVEKDREAFNAIIDNHYGDYNKPSKMIENYKLFLKLVSESKYSGQELFEGMYGLNMVYINLDGGIKAENPQVIFESLNSTGVSLSASDLVRNFLLMQLDSETQERLYKHYWLKIEELFSSNIFTEFIRHYLIMKTNKLVKKEDVYSTYKNFYADNKYNSEKAVADLYEYAKFYDSLLNNTSYSDEFNQIINHINIMDKKVVYPYFMKLMGMEESGDITWDDIVKIGHVVESLLYRRMVCGIPSNGLNRIVVSLTNRIEGNDEFKNLQKRLLKSNFPDNKEFKSHLIDYQIYNKKRNRAKLTLIILEENRTKETIDFDDAQVEHIMPRKLSNDWKINVPNADAINHQYGGTIGNLTLTKYNQEMSNKIYAEKREYYSESNISLTREVAKNYSKWDKESIIDRANKLADELIKIFPKPKMLDEAVAIDISGEHPIDEELDVTGMKPIRLTIQNNDLPVSSWANCLVVFLDYVWENDSETYDRIKNDSSVGNMIFSKFRSPKALKNGEKIETNFSANVIAALLAKMSEICGIEDEVSYTLK